MDSRFDVWVSRMCAMTDSPTLQNIIGAAVEELHLFGFSEWSSEASDFFLQGGYAIYTSCLALAATAKDSDPPQIRVRPLGFVHPLDRNGPCSRLYLFDQVSDLCRIQSRKHPSLGRLEEKSVVHGLVWCVVHVTLPMRFEKLRVLTCFNRDIHPKVQTTIDVAVFKTDQPVLGFTPNQVSQPFLRKAS